MAQNYRYRGEKVQLLETDITHPSRTGNLVNSGDPVNSGVLVGVALLTPTANTEYVTVATEGVWDLYVHGFGETVSTAVSIGDRVYIEDGLLNVDDTHTPFGIALGEVVAHANTLIPVKVCGAGN